ncbi:hypothetical protein Dimus_035812, partial [Dionaea muscipula]
ASAAALVRRSGQRSWGAADSLGSGMAHRCDAQQLAVQRMRRASASAELHVGQSTQESLALCRWFGVVSVMIAVAGARRQ